MSTGKKKITGGIDYLDEIEFSDNNDEVMYYSIERLKPLKQKVINYTKKKCSRNRNLITGDPES